MKYFTTLILVVFWFSTHAQFLHPKVPYQQITYDGLNPHWYETSFDPSFVTDSLDGYNQIKETFSSAVSELIYDDLIITAYYLSQYSWFGTYIECRSIKTGELLWHNKFGAIDNDHVELLALMYINEDGRLEVFSHKERIPYNNRDFSNKFRNMVITKRVYDLMSGALLSNYHRAYDDPMSFHSFTSYLPFGSSRLFKEGNHIRYIENFSNVSNAGKRSLRSCLLDHTGASITPVDTIEHEYFTFIHNLVKLHDDTIVHIQMNRNTHRLYFKYMSPELKQYYEVVSDSLPYDITNISFEALSSDSSKFLFYNNFPNNESHLPHYEIMVFDRRANLLKYGFLPFKGNDFLVLEWEDTMADFVIVDRLNTVVSGAIASQLRVYKLSEDQNIEFIKIFYGDNPLRFAVLFSSHRIANDKYYWRISERAFGPGTVIYFIDDHASAYSQMVVDKVSLGLLSDVTDEKHTLLNNVKVYPNPTHEMCFLDFEMEFSGDIWIYNSTGSVMDHFDIASQKQISLKTNQYAPGLYYIACVDNRSSQHIQTLKFIKVD